MQCDSHFRCPHTGGVSACEPVMVASTEDEEIWLHQCQIGIERISRPTRAARILSAAIDYLSDLVIAATVILTGAVLVWALDSIRYSRSLVQAAMILAVCFTLIALIAGCACTLGSKKEHTWRNSSGH